METAATGIEDRVAQAPSARAKAGRASNVLRSAGRSAAGDTGAEATAEFDDLFVKVFVGSATVALAVMALIAAGSF